MRDTRGGEIRRCICHSQPPRLAAFYLFFEVVAKLRHRQGPLSAVNYAMGVRANGYQILLRVNLVLFVNLPNGCDVTDMDEILHPRAIHSGKVESTRRAQVIM